MTSLLVIGGARSGKSRYAQERAEGTDLSCLYVATAQAFDQEMSERIALHRSDRGPQWKTVEAPIQLAQIIEANSQVGTLLLVDCLTLWTSNLMLAELDILAALSELEDAIARAKGDLIFVSNEVGCGIVPDNALARRFRDEAGRINQRIAARVDEVQLLVAGLNIKMKG